MEPQTAVFDDMGEKMKSTFTEDSLKEFEWQWVMICLLVNNKKDNPNRKYAKKLWRKEEE